MNTRTMNIIIRSSIVGFVFPFFALIAGLSLIQTIVSGVVVGAISGLLYAVVCKIVRKDIV